MGKVIKYLNNKMDRYHRKTNAIEKTWFILGRNSRYEMKRAMAVWKEKNRFNNHNLFPFLFNDHT